MGFKMLLGIFPYGSKRKVTTLIFLGALLFSSFFLWRSIAQAVLLPHGSDFLIPLFWFSLIVVLFATISVLIEQRAHFFLVPIAVLLPSLILIHTLAHSLILGVSIALTFLALLRIEKELKERVHLSIRKSLLSGLPLFLLALSLTLTSAYYVYAKQLSWEELLPSFQLSERNTTFLMRLLSTVYPPFQKLEKEAVTVDNFLEATGSPMERSKSSEGYLKGVAALENSPFIPELRESAVRAFILNQKRNSLSELVGRPVRGDEMMSRLIAEALRAKIVKLMVTTNANPSFSVPVLPLVLALFLFLTVYPITILLLPLWAGCATLIVRLFLWLGILSIKRLMVMQECLTDEGLTAKL